MRTLVALQTLTKVDGTGWGIHRGQHLMVRVTVVVHLGLVTGMLVIGVLDQLVAAIVAVTLVDSIAMVVITATATIHLVVTALEQVVPRPLLPLVQKEVSVETQTVLMHCHFF